MGRQSSPCSSWTLVLRALLNIVWLLHPAGGVDILYLMWLFDRVGLSVAFQIKGTDVACGECGRRVGKGFPVPPVWNLIEGGMNEDWSQTPLPIHDLFTGCLLCKLGLNYHGLCWHYKTQLIWHRCWQSYPLPSIKPGWRYFSALPAVCDIVPFSMGSQSLEVLSLVMPLHWITTGEGLEGHAPLDLPVAPKILGIAHYPFCNYTYQVMIYIYSFQANRI